MRLHNQASDKIKNTPTGVFLDEKHPKYDYWYETTFLSESASSAHALTWANHPVRSEMPVSRTVCFIVDFVAHLKQT